MNTHTITQKSIHILPPLAHTEPSRSVGEGPMLPTHIFYNISGIHEFIVLDTCTIYIFLQSTEPSELTVITRCTQAGAHVDLRIIHIQKNTQALTLHTVQEHEVPHATSIVTVKGVLYDQAQFNYQGKIYVGIHAEHTHAEQKSHTLLLSSTARAQATPSLEVLTKKVQCKHGSAVAALNNPHMDYLASRGITSQDAQEILIKSFLLSCIDDQQAQVFFLSLAENS